MIIIVVFEIVADSHKSVMILVLELLYSSTYVVENILLLCKHKYFADDEKLQE